MPEFKNSVLGFLVSDFVLRCRVAAGWCGQHTAGAGHGRLPGWQRLPPATETWGSGETCLKNDSPTFQTCFACPEHSIVWREVKVEPAPAETDEKP